MFRYHSNNPVKTGLCHEQMTLIYNNSNCFKKLVHFKRKLCWNGEFFKIKFKHYFQHTQKSRKIYKRGFLNSVPLPNICYTFSTVN